MRESPISRPARIPPRIYFHRAVLTIVTAFLLAAAPLSASLSAQVSQWTGGNGNPIWNDPGNWDAGVPDASTDAVILSSAAVFPAVFTVDPETRDLTIQSGASLTLGGGFNLDVHGTFVNDGSFSAGGQAVELVGTGMLGGTSVTTFAALAASGGGTRTLSQDVNAGSFTLRTGTTLAMGSQTLTVTGNFVASASGATMTGTGSVVLTGTGSVTTGSNGIPNLTVSSGTRTANTARVTGDLTVSGGTFTINDSATFRVLGNALLSGGTVQWATNFAGVETLDVDGNLTITGASSGSTSADSLCLVGGHWANDGTWAPATGTTRLDGAGATTVGGAAPRFHHLAITAGTKTVSSAATITGNVTLSDGATLDTDAALDVAGDVTLGDATATWDAGGTGITHTIAGATALTGGLVSSGASITGDATLEFDGALDVNCASQGTPIGVPNVRVASTGKVSFFGVSVNGDLEMASGTLELLNNATLAVSGNATLSGGTLRFFDTGAGLETLDVAGNVDLTGCTAGLMNVSTRVNCAGDWTSTASWTPLAGTVTLDGGTAANISAAELPSTTIASGTKTFTTPAHVSGTLNIADGATLDADAALDVDGNAALNAAGTWDVGVDAHTVSGNLTSTGGNAVGTGLIELDGAGTLTTSGGGEIASVRITGTRTAGNATITNDLTMTGGSLEILDNVTLLVKGNADLDAPGTLLWTASTTGTQDVLDVDGDADITCAAGTTTVQSRLRVAGNWSSDGGFAPGDGLVELDGPGGATIGGPAPTFFGLRVMSDRTVASAATVVGDLTLDEGVTLTANAPLDVDGDVSLGATSAWDLGADTHTVAGGWTSLGGSATSASTGRVDFDGTGGLATGGGAIQAVLVSAGTRNAGDAAVTDDLELNGAGATLAIGDGTTLSVGGNVDLLLGSLDFPGSGSGTPDVLDVEGDADVQVGVGSASSDARFRVAGNWVSTATFAPGVGIVEFDGGTTTTASGPSFADLSVVSGTKSLTGTTTLAGSLRVEAGATLTLPTSSTTLTVDLDAVVDGTLAMDDNDVSVAGGWTSSAPGAAVTGTADVVLTGSGSMGTGTNPLPGVRVTGGTRLAADSAVGGDLDVESGATLELLDDALVTVGGNMLVAAGASLGFQSGAVGLEILDVEGDVTLDGNSSTTSADTRLRCAGNLTTAAAWTPAAGEVQLDGGTTTTFGGPALVFPNLRVASGDKTATTAVGVTGDLVVADGATLHTTAAVLTVGDDVTLGTSGGWDLGALTHDVAGDLTGTGADAVGTVAGTVRFTSGGLVSLGGGSVQNIVADAGTRNFNAVDVLGDVTFNAGSMRVNNNANVTVGGNLTVAGVLEWFGTAVGGDDVLDVAGDVDLSAASSGSSSADSLLRVGGNWLSTSAFAPGGGRVEFSGNGVTAGGTLPTFPALRLLTGSLVTVTAAAVVDDTLTVETGATLDTDAALSVGGGVSLGATGGWDTGALTHTLGGAFTSAGAAATDGAAGSTLLFTGNGPIGGNATVVDNVHVQAGSHNMSSLTITGDLTLDAGSLSLQNNQVVTVAGNADFNGGTLGFVSTSAGDEVLDIEGDVLMQATAGTTSAGTVIRCAGGWIASPAFAPGSGTVHLDGAAITALGPVTPGSDVTFDGLVVSNGIREASDDFDLLIDTLTIESGAELRINGKRMAVPGSSIIVNGELDLDAGSELALGSTGVLSVSPGGNLRVVGTPGNPATIAGEAGGGYFLSIDGNLEAYHFVFQEMGPTGVIINQNATLGAAPEDLRAGTFSHPSAIPGSVMLDIRRSAPTEFRYVDFDDPFANGTFNVRTLGGAAITFVNSSGSLSGEDFDSEILGLVSWVEDTTGIVDFFATAGLLQVTLDWTTFAEVDAADFVIKRATTFGGPFVPIGNVTPTGAPGSYQLVDNAVVAQQFYVYQLWETLEHGSEQLIAQRTATPWGPDLPANVLDVAPSGGSYSDIGAAIADAALTINPVIKVSAGSYPAFDVDPVFGTLRIYADGTGAVDIDTTAQPVRILGQAATSAVELHGLNIGDGTGTNDGILVQNCLGLVALDSLTVQGGVGAAGIRVDNSDRVAVDRSDVSGTPGIRVANGSTAVAGGGTLDDVEVAVNSELRTSGLVGYGSTVDGTSLLFPFASTHSEIEAPRFPVLDTPFSVTMTGAPSGTWFLFLSFDIAWLDLFGAGELAHHHVGLIDLDLGNLLILGPMPGSGTLSFPGTLPPDALLLGFPIVLQVVVQDPGTLKYNWSNSTTLIGMPQ